MNKLILCLLLLSYFSAAKGTTLVYASDDCDSVGEIKKHIMIEVDTSQVKSPQDIPLFKSAQGITFAANPTFEHSITKDNCGGYQDGDQPILLGGPGGEKLVLTQIKLFAPYQNKQCGEYKIGLFIKEPRCVIVLKQQ